MRTRILAYLAGAIFVLSTLYVAGRSLPHQAGNDATVFYFGARLLLRGENAYDPSAMHAEWEASRVMGNTRPEPGPFANPPLTALLVAPIAAFPLSAAMWLYKLLSLGYLAVSVYLLDRTFAESTPMATRFVLATWVVLLPPIMKVLSYGQSALLVCAPLAAALYCAQRRRDAWAGFWLALSLAKFTISLPFVALFALQRRWKLVFASLVSFLGLNLAIAIPVGVTKLVTSYVAALVSFDGVGSMNDPFSPLATDPSNMISAKSFFILLLGKNRASVGLALWAFSAIFAVMFVYVLLRSERKALPPSPDRLSPLEGLQVALATMSALALMYHRVYDLAALMFVIYGFAAYRFRSEDRASTTATIAIATLVLLSFFVVGGTGWAKPFDFVLTMLSLPRAAYFGSVFVIALLLQVTALLAKSSTPGPEPSEPYSS
jgi:hypothetical protein